MSFEFFVYFLIIQAHTPQSLGVFFFNSCFFFSLFKHFNWRLITLQYCGSFCHTFTWISRGCTCVPHSDPPSNLPPHPISQGHPSAPAQSTLPHASNLGLVIYFTYDNIDVSMLLSQTIPPLPSPTESKSLFYTSVSLLLSRIHCDLIVCGTSSLEELPGLLESVSTQGSVGCA